jgi:hypothetical protein
VTVAVESAVIVPIVAVKTFVAVPEVTTMLAGTVTKLEFEVSPTVVLVAADWERVTVQELVPPDIPPLGLHTTELTTTCATREIVAVCDEPL